MRDGVSPKAVTFNNRPSLMHIPVLMSEPRLSAYLDVKIRTLRDWRSKRIIPFLKVNRKVQYVVGHVLEALSKYERKVR